MSHTVLILLELGGVLSLLAIMARLAGRLAISPIPLYLAAGLALGEGGLLPQVTSESFVETGADIGVVLLLLMLGLEYSGRELVGNLRRASPVGLLDLGLNFTPGFLAGLLLGLGTIPSLFLGGVTYISSSGVVAKVLGDLGWSGNRETPLVLSVLVFEDLAMAVILTVLGAPLLVAGLAEMIHVSAAVGAFLVGIGISGPAAHRAESLLAPVRDLFAAVFFVFFGLSTDPSILPAVVGPVVALAVVTTCTKWLVAWIGGARAGIGPRSRWRAATLLSARGEFSIIIAGLGIAAGGSSRLSAIAAGYVPLTATLGPIMALVADRWPLREPRPRSVPSSTPA